MTFWKCLQFFNTYSDFFVIGMFLSLIFVAIVNWTYNPYCRQNRRLDKCSRVMTLRPEHVFDQPKLLSGDYRRQWRAYLNSHADKPSAVFEFVPKRHRVLCVRLLVLSTAVAVCFAVSFAFSLTTSDILVFAVYALSLIVVLLLSRAFFLARERRAKRKFGKFVALLNKRNANCVPPASNLTEDILTINGLARKQPDDETLDRVAEILHKNGLDNTRTVEEQRKLNNAVNALLLAYSARFGQANQN